MTPESKLSSRRWRVVNSWWILPPILSGGALGWLGFMVAGIRTHQARYWLSCGLYAVCFGTFFVLSGVTDGNAPGWAAIPFLAAWIGATVHAAAWNRGYLRTVATQGAWYDAPATPVASPSTGGPAGQPGPSSAPDGALGVSGTGFYGSGPTPAASSGTSGDRIDVRHASVEELSALPGVDRALAQRIVTTRDVRGGYRDLDDLVAAVGLQPHELVRLRGRLTFGPPQDQSSDQHPDQHLPPTGQHGSGRILDI